MQHCELSLLLLDCAMMNLDYMMYRLDPMLAC